MNKLDQARQLQCRTLDYAVKIIRLCEIISRQETARVLGKQLLRCGTSMAANYRAACRSKSPADFISKMGTVVEETDETLFWLELLVQANLLTLEMAQPLVQEATELLRIFSKSLSTAKHNL